MGVVTLCTVSCNYIEKKLASPLVTPAKCSAGVALIKNSKSSFLGKVLGTWQRPDFSDFRDPMIIFFDSTDPKQVPKTHPQNSGKRYINDFYRVCQARLYSDLRRIGWKRSILMHDGDKVKISQQKVDISKCAVDLGMTNNCVSLDENT